MLEGMVRAIAEGIDQIAGFIAVFSATQVLGSLLGNAIFGAYVSIKTSEHLNNITAQIVLDNGTITAQNAKTALSNANIEARILAYNDLFFAIWVAVSTAFLISFVLWLYRRYHKIDVLEKQMQQLHAYLASVKQ